MIWLLIMVNINGGAAAHVASFSEQAQCEAAAKAAPGMGIRAMCVKGYPPR